MVHRCKWLVALHFFVFIFSSAYMQSSVEATFNLNILYKRLLNVFCLLKPKPSSRWAQRSCCEFSPGTCSAKREVKHVVMWQPSKNVAVERFHILTYYQRLLPDFSSILVPSKAIIVLDMCMQCVPHCLCSHTV